MIQLTQDQVVTLGTISLMYLAAVFVVVAAVRAFFKLRKGIKHEIVTNTQSQAITHRKAGQVTEREGEFFLCVERRGYSMPYIVSLRNNAVAEATGRSLLPYERECTAAAFYPDGVPLPPVQPLPPSKTKQQHAEEFSVWYWNNSLVSGASPITQYTPSEIADDRTNANCRRAFAAWLAAKGV